MGCFFRQQATVELPALEVACRACAALVSVPQGASEATCESCGSLVQRSARTFGAERDLIVDAMGAHAPEAAGSAGIPGMPVDDSNREGYVLAGLVRVATGYSALVSGPRFASLVRKTWPKASDKERAHQLAAALRLGKADGSATPEGVKLLEEARRLLGA